MSTCHNDQMQTKRLKLGTNLNTITSFDDARLLLDENINMVNTEG